MGLTAPSRPPSDSPVLTGLPGQSLVAMSLRAGVKKRSKAGDGAASAGASGAAGKSDDEDESYDQDEGGSKYSRLTP